MLDLAILLVHIQEAGRGVGWRWQDSGEPRLTALPTLPAHVVSTCSSVTAPSTFGGSGPGVLLCLMSLHQPRSCPTLPIGPANMPPAGEASAYLGFWEILCLTSFYSSSLRQKPKCRCHLGSPQLSKLESW